MNLVYDQLATKEAKFSTTLRDSYGKVFTSTESTIIDGAVRLHHDNDNWYYKAKSKKTKIVLHFTAGLLHADIGELTRDTKVSVPYVLARNGTTYELFDPKYWSYHLGRGASGGNTAMSKGSIGIEISNAGKLTHDEETGFLNTWSGKAYCSLEQTEAYVHVPDGFRGYNYFATYTTAQYKALDSLITNLCREYDILRKLPKVLDRAKKLTGDPGEGIWSHQNFRKDKLDIGPAFNWEKISGR
jgi:N-acetyl-anhydromuramyl-L-alanine amidase AmpD